MRARLWGALPPSVNAYRELTATRASALPQKSLLSQYAPPPSLRSASRVGWREASHLSCSTIPAILAFKASRLCRYGTPPRRLPPLRPQSTIGASHRPCPFVGSANRPLAALRCNQLLYHRDGRCAGCCGKLRSIRVAYAAAAVPVDAMPACATSSAGGIDVVATALKLSLAHISAATFCCAAAVADSVLLLPLLSLLLMLVSSFRFPRGYHRRCIYSWPLVLRLLVVTAAVLVDACFRSCYCYDCSYRCYPS